MDHEIHIHVYVGADSSGGVVVQKLNEILRRLTVIETKEDQMAANLDSVLADVTAEPTLIDSLSTLIQGLRDQITAAAGDQVKVQAIFDAAEANKAKLLAALAAGTPIAGNPAVTAPPVTT